MGRTNPRIWARTRSRFNVRFMVRGTCRSRGLCTCEFRVRFIVNILVRARVKIKVKLGQAKGEGLT